ncbi:TIGR00730 family Rossman fold protein [Deinococcus wulumuqiensis]|nr:TIGR00730 family Rossman fold protein [Deinococcus wulumuqiensis]
MHRRRFPDCAGIKRNPYDGCSASWASFPSDSTAWRISRCRWSRCTAAPAPRSPTAFTAWRRRWGANWWGQVSAWSRAANQGAYEAGGVSVGLNIALPHEQRHNPYQTLSLEFEYFHARKVMLARYSHAFVAFPGGFGTLDEMMEILTLVQTRKMRPVPIYFVGEAHWRGLVEWFRASLVEQGAIAADDLKLFKLVDDVSRIPADVLAYHDPGTGDGFKRPTAADTEKARGEQPT